jgi:hypothetical protein
MPDQSAKTSVINDYVEIRKKWLSDAEKDVEKTPMMRDLAMLVAAQHIADAVNRLANQIGSLDHSLRNK